MKKIKIPELEIENGPLYIRGTTPSPQQNDIVEGYRLESYLRETNCSIVFICTDLNNPADAKKAIKFIKRREGRIWQIKNEIYFLNTLRGSRILPLYDCFCYNEYVCIVTPYARYQSIQAVLNDDYKEGMPENVASIMMGQMLEAVDFLHSNFIWHRDIKPDNFLIFNNELTNLRVTLCDFGFAKQYAEGETDDQYLGTPDFMAPEIVKKKSYNHSVDIWSLGVSLYVMLTNQSPFAKYSKNKVLWKLQVKSADLNYDLLFEKDISEDAIDLIRSMCQKEPSQRIGLKQALLHPWILGERKLNRTESQISRIINEAEGSVENDVDSG